MLSQPLNMPSSIETVRKRCIRMFTEPRHTALALLTQHVAVSEIPYCKGVFPYLISAFLGKTLNIYFRKPVYF